MSITLCGVPPVCAKALTEVVHVPDVLLFPCHRCNLRHRTRLILQRGRRARAIGGRRGGRLRRLRRLPSEALRRRAWRSAWCTTSCSVDVMLDQRLRDAIALVVRNRPHPRAACERKLSRSDSVVRSAVYEAVADELASGNPLWPQR